MSMGGNLGDGGFFGQGGGGFFGQGPAGLGPRGPFGLWPGVGCSSLFIILGGLCLVCGGCFRMFGQ